MQLSFETLGTPMLKPEMLGSNFLDHLLIIDASKILQRTADVAGSLLRQFLIIIPKSTVVPKLKLCVLLEFMLSCWNVKAVIDDVLIQS
jgi:hypothetical protein